MPSAYFVSDVHIVSPACARAELFLRFLRTLSAANATHLFLLGDIFDLWVAGHRYFVDRYRTIVDEVVRLRNEGVEVHYFEGNHDLHLERFWQRKLGVAVHGGPLHVELAGKALRLEHGDEMDPDDRGYRFLRWFLRTPPVRFLVCHLPGRLVAWIGRRASARSRTYTSSVKSVSAAEAVAKIRAHAMRAHAERPFDVIISGHVHVPDDHREENGSVSFRSINLGSWLDRPCFLRLDESGLRLVELPGAWQTQPGGAVTANVGADR